MRLSASLTAILVGWSLVNCTAFEPPAVGQQQQGRPSFLLPTTNARHRLVGNTALFSWFGRSDRKTYKQRQRIRQEISNLEDEDFLLADLKPKLLAHVSYQCAHCASMISERLLT